MSSIHGYINVGDIVGERLSDTYYKRKWFLDNDVVPMQKTVRKSLGSPLTQVLFDDIPVHLRILLGIEPPLVGPGDQLWVYPSDELAGNPVLKPVTTKDIQALTHLGILAAGDKIIEDLEEAKRKAICDSINDNDEIWKWIVKEQCKKCAKHSIKKERIIQREDIENILYTFIDIHRKAINAIEEIFSKKMEDKMSEFSTQLYSVTLEDKEKALEELRDKLTAEFEEQMDEEVTSLKEQFNMVIQFEQAHFAYEMDERTKALRHQLECRGMADILYVACAERHRYLMKQAAMENEYIDKIESLKTQLKLYEDHLEDISSKFSNNLCIEQKLRDSMAILCKQFKKLLSYHLNLPPTQLGFLPELESVFIDTIPHNMQCVDPKDNKPKDDQESNILDEKVESMESQYEDDGENKEKKPFVVYGDMNEEVQHSKFLFGSLKSLPSRTVVNGKILRNVSTNTFDVPGRHHGSQHFLDGGSLEKSYPYLKKRLSGASDTTSMKNSGLPTILKEAVPSKKDMVKQNLSSTVTSQKTLKANLDTASGGSSESRIRHRDSITVLRLSVAKNQGGSSSQYIERECPTQMCAIKKMLGFNLPPYMNKLAFSNFEDMQKMTYEDFSLCTPDQLKFLTERYSKSEKTNQSSPSSLNLAAPPFKFLHKSNDGLNNTKGTNIPSVIGTDDREYLHLRQTRSSVDHTKSSTSQITPPPQSTFKLFGDKDSFSHLEPLQTQPHTLESIRKIFHKQPDLSKKIIK